MIEAIVVALAGVAGAMGVTVYALAAHMAEAGSADRFALVNAAIMMLAHGAAGLALVAISRSRKGATWRWQTTAAMMVVGALLFGGAVALPRLSGLHLFAMAAPTGGAVTILAWLTVAINAFVDVLGSGRDLR